MRRFLTLLSLIGLAAVPVTMPMATQTAAAQSAATASVVLAGGCFWCIESDFEKIPGVLEATSGFSGGTVANPTYKQVVAGGTGHYEVVKVDYDPAQVSFAQLISAFWYSTDPTDAGGQFCDRGQSYGNAIFVDGAGERAAAEASKQALIDSGVAIITPILNSAPFYPAEDYHQNYAKKNPIRYRFYRSSCGRDARVNRLWGDAAYKGIK